MDDSTTSDAPEAIDAQQTEAPDFSADSPWVRLVHARIYGAWEAQAFQRFNAETDEHFAERRDIGMRRLMRDTFGYASRVRSVASHIGLLTEYLKAPEDPAAAYAHCLAVQDAMFNSLPMFTLERRRELAGALITEGAAR